MRWRGRRQSENVMDASTRGPGRGPGRRAAVGGGLGVLVLAVVALLMGGDPSALLAALQGQAASAGGGPVREATPRSPEEEEMIAFLSVVLADTEQVWSALFAEDGEDYPEPPLWHFRDVVDSACGTQTSQVGPFYCPADRSIYLDLSFFHELAKRHNAAGDFAQAYVVAHEVGHHVQNVLGVSRFVAGKKRGLSEVRANQWSVRQELHADFLAGVWGFHAQRTLEVLDPGDLEEALNAAAQIGDDTLQRRARGYVQPDGFTHGTAAQRQRWFRLGFDTGDTSAGEAVFTLPYDEL